jgi:hypothetical protein
MLVHAVIRPDFPGICPVLPPKTPAQGQDIAIPNQANLFNQFAIWHALA